jgi:hypothetical protein
VAKPSTEWQTPQSARAALTYKPMRTRTLLHECCRAQWPSMAASERLQSRRERPQRVSAQVAIGWDAGGMRGDGGLRTLITHSAQRHWAEGQAGRPSASCRMCACRHVRARAARDARLLWPSVVAVFGSACLVLPTNPKRDYLATEGLQHLLEQHGWNKTFTEKNSLPPKVKTRDSARASYARTTLAIQSDRRPIAGCVYLCFLLLRSHAG